MRKAYRPAAMKPVVRAGDLSRPRRHARRRPLAVSWAIVCVPFGGMIGGLLAAEILPTQGWRTLFLLAGAAPIAIALDVGICRHDRRRQLDHLRDASMAEYNFDSRCALSIFVQSPDGWRVQSGAGHPSFDLSRDVFRDSDQRRMPPDFVELPVDVDLCVPKTLSGLVERRIG
jgi:hypothetical protein